MFRFLTNRNLYIEENFTFIMQKKGQLGIIEFKYFMIGLLIGLVIALVLVWLGTADVLPFKVPLVCG